MKYLIILLSMSIAVNSFSQQVINLYDKAIPNSINVPDTELREMREDSILVVTNVSRPTLTAYFPPEDKATGDAIIVCPGGGYGMIAAGHEGEDVAKRLNAIGIAAFVLKYRLPNKQWMVNPEIGPLQDAQRAIQIVRQNATRWNLKKNMIGILGFSAGGHLAATASTLFHRKTIPNRKKTNLRPDFVVLIYPVISFSDSFGHIGSRENLIGKDASPEKIREYSNELNVTNETPPAFLVHAKDDPVDVRNTTVFADVLNEKGVFSEVLLFESGGHGFGLVNKASDIQWIERMEAWLQKLMHRSVQSK